MIDDLIRIKKRLLDQHSKYEMPDASEYREGILGGITVALMQIEQMIEEEDRDQARYHGEE